MSSVVDESAAGFTENLVLAGILKIGETPYASIMNKETKETLFVSTTPNDHGIQIEKLESSSDLSKVVLTLKKGNETGTLRYDEQFINRSLSESAMAAPPSNPANPGSQKSP
ncbi:MAG: hypothetical protein HC904_17170, partial [Blastochloris sp.]|nr:hypothetical protein [Blastochloris sp.]